MFSLLRRPIPTLLLLLCLSLCVTAYTSSSNPALVLRSDASTPTDCSTDQSADYFGFGVRIGVYFAWLSAWLANVCLPDEINGNLDTSTIFLLSLLISLFHGTTTSGLAKVDALVVLHLSSGFLFSSLSLWGYRTLYYVRDGPSAISNFGGFGTHARLVLTTSISAYGLWFWWEGVEDALKVSDTPGCQVVYTWFFAKLPIDGGIHILYIVICLGCSVYYGIMCLTAGVSILHMLFRKHAFKRKPVFHTGLNEQQLLYIHTFLRVGNFVWLIFCAVMIEITINNNNLLQVMARYGHITSPSQLLPLVVGAFSFLRTLFILAKEKWEDYHPKVDASVTGTTDTSIPSSNKETANHSSHISRPYHIRCLVTWLPWLSIYPFWTKRIPHTELPSTETEAKQMALNEHEIKS